MKIAVHCKTKEEWERVETAEFKKGRQWRLTGAQVLGEWHVYGSESAINVSKKNLMYCNIDHYEGVGYRIISAQEYLGNKPITYEELYVPRISVGGVNPMPEEAFNAMKSIVNKLNKKGEDNMNIKSTVAKVFKDTDEAILVSRWLGIEYDENNHRAVIALEKNKKEVLAEAKRLEADETD